MAAGAGGAAAPAEAGGGTIAYGCEIQLCATDGDGSNPRGLTFSGAGPEWSPDGTAIAYSRTVSDVGYAIFVADSTGANPRRVATSAGFDEQFFAPAWSPDGTEILFSNSRTNSHYPRLEVVRLADGARRVLFESPYYATCVPPSCNTAGFIGAAIWSPDGSQILFDYSGNAQGVMEIYRLGSAGGTPQPITNDHSRDFGVEDWSPAGDRIVGVAGYPAAGSPCTGCRQAFTMRPDGTGFAIVPTLEDSISGITWSPDGSRLAIGAATSPGRLFTTDTAGGNRVDLSRGVYGNTSVGSMDWGLPVAPASAPGGASPGTVGAPAAGGTNAPRLAVRIARVLRYRRSRVLARRSLFVSVRCSQRCVIALRLSARRPGRRQVAVGSGRASLPAAGTRTVRVHLSGSRRRLRRLLSGLTLTARVRGSSTQVVTVRRRVRLR
jgi:hypothetical protein